MKCFVCGNEMKPFLEKNFAMDYLDKCEYVRCEHCGIVVSKTLYEMPHDKWIALNVEFHNKFLKGERDMATVDSQWIERLEIQAELFANLVNLGLFKSDWRTIDYGADDGTLANKINSKLGKVWLKKFDAYLESYDENYLSPDEVKPSSFDFLLTSSVFEHLLGNQGDVDNIINLIKPSSVMALHTLICDEVPRDPNWFYLEAIHCTMWTNKAMSIIYKKFGFKGCAYNLESRMWFMFRNVEDFERLKSAQLPGTWQFGEDFVDYWKIKPYRS